METPAPPEASGLNANSRNKEQFLNELVLQLASSMQDVIGLEEAEGFIKMVGLHIGDAISADYKAGAEIPEWDAHYLAKVLVDLKAKIDGGFSIERFDAQEIVLRNDRCPFGPAVEGRPALCQMTSSVFGRIASRHFDHVNVAITESIARGADHCRVRVRLNAERPTPGGVDFYKAQ